MPGLPKVAGEPGGPGVHRLRDHPQAAGAVVDRVHAGRDGEQHLRGADVGGRLLPPDVLLAGLQREPEGRGAVDIPGHADQPARQGAFESGPDGDVARVRAAVEQRHAEPLAGADGDIGAPLPRWRGQGQGQQISGRDDQRAGRMGPVGDRAQFVGAGQPPAGARRLDHHREGVDLLQRLQQRPVGADHLEAQGGRAGGHHPPGLGQDVARRPAAPGPS